MGRYSIGLSRVPGLSKRRSATHVRVASGSVGCGNLIAISKVTGTSSGFQLAASNSTSAISAALSSLFGSLNSHCSSLVSPPPPFLSLWLSKDTSTNRSPFLASVIAWCAALKHIAASSPPLNSSRLFGHSGRRTKFPTRLRERL